MSLAADDPESQARLAAFAQGLQQLGWTVGQNVRVDYRWALNADTMRKYATELVALAPDVILATSISGRSGASSRRPASFPSCSRLSSTPSALASSRAWRGRAGNVTGFLLFEYGISGKWLDLLKQIAPGVARAAVLRDPTIASGSGQLGAIQGAAPAFGVELRPVDVRDAGEIERAVAAFAHASNGGLIVTASVAAVVHRDLIIGLAARHRLPAIYTQRCLRYQRRPNCLWA